MRNDSIITKSPPQPHSIPPPNGDGRVKQIREDCLFCFTLLDLPELLSLAVLDLAEALAASL